MSDETPGAGQGALPPREGQSLRPLVERPAATGPTMRLTQVVGGQYVLTTQPHGIPSLAQIAPGSLSGNPGLTQGGVTRIISISPQRVGQSSPLRPSLANQSIVNVLTKSRSNPNVRLQLFPSGESSGSAAQQTTHSRPLKRQLSAAVEKKDGYSSKLQHVLNHRIVRSKLVKEKYNEHLLESFYLEGGNNILDLYQFAKRPKTQAYIAYLKEHAIDPRDYQELNSIVIPQTTPSTPSATSASSLPGISNTHTVPTSTPSVSVPESNSNMSTPKSVSTKNKSSLQPSLSSQELIVEKAKQEAYVVQRIADLQKEGLWSEKRLPKVQDMHRTKAHWDFLLEEMVWLAADFAQERKWKKAAAKKCARMVQKYFQDKALAAQKAEKAHEQNLRRIASFCAKEIKIFWSNVEKLVEYKQNAILEEKRKKALDQQLSFIVDQTEKYSQLLAEGMNKTADPPASAISSRSVSRAQSDTEFDPDLQSDEDDEETIEQEEAALDDEGHKEEIEALQKESQMELDDLLEDELLKNYLLNRDNIRLSESDDSDNDQDPGETSTKSEVEQERESGKAEIQEIEDKVPSEDSDSSKEDEESEEESEDETTMSESITQGEHTELKLLVEDSHKEGEVTKTEDKNDDLINDAAAIAESIQPKGNTLSSTNVSTNIPFLLKYSLREYQHIGLDWLVTMYERKLNGILADEMGLGKTIQTIALLAHLACEKENWGPHLIVVPTSVMLNWEMECKKWCPAFKILTYYGSQKERKLKRTGWTKPNAFHICITSYKLVIQDHQSFRRKKWKYLILDEAQNIKNFKSQRWQLLLNFQTQQRLLLTGTPLQNNLMELWSLMHFLMPNVFQSHREFKEWFSNPVTGMIEGNSEYNESIIKRLHKVLRPFLLRRLKSEVEKQMPKKYEHVVVCRLSKRQRFLYDDYMSRANTRETLATGNLLSVINVLMQLRKVCNHPNLFEVRPTISPFQCDNISLHIPSIVFSALDYDPSKHVDLNALNLLLIMQEIHFGSYQCYRMRQSRHSWKITELDQSAKPPPPCPPCKLAMRVLPEKSVEVKVEKKELVTISQPPPLQLKTLTPHNVMQLVNQQGILKTIPVVNISQGTTGQIGAPVNVTSLLKPADKISAGFAQLVQTSTGKHLLLRTNPNITANIPVTSAGGQKLTFLSQPVSTIGNAGHAVTQAFVKFQLTSVTTVANTSSVTTTNSISVVKSEENKTKSGRTQVGNDYIGRLYSKQNSLDVRWASEEKVVGLSDEEDLKGERRRRLCLMNSINESRCSALPLYGRDFQEAVKIFSPNKINCWHGGTVHCLNALYDTKVEETPNYLRALLCNPEERIEQLQDICDRFIFYVPAVKCQEPELRVWHPPPSKYWKMKEDKLLIQKLFSKPATPLHHIASAMVTQFPDPRLIQYDCGKLQTLDRLLRKLKVEGHRALIFTQMTKMLDVLEAFLNFHGHIYLRLDGTTKVDQRQVLMERFNGDTRIFAFILSTRSGGVGVNLTGADTVIFYDSDWNPTMDAQAQDRCHRIGQTRDVHIYRLVSERTIEENILKKANQKRLLGDLAIEGGNFTTAYFKSSTIQDLFNVDQNEESAANRMSEVIEIKRDREKALSGETSTSGDDKVAMGALENALAACEDDQDVQAAKTAKAEAVADLAEFDENIPLEEQEKEKEKEPEISKAEQEINSVIEKLSAIERYAMKFIETTESAWSAEQLAAAEREIEEQKREWEQNRLAAMREEEERRARELEEDGDIITFSREDATNQVSSKSKVFNRRRKFLKVNKKRKANKIVRRSRSTSESKGKVKKRKVRILMKDNIDSNESTNQSDFDNSQRCEDLEESQLNGDTDNSMHSIETEEFNSTNFKNISNHVDHNSPRTRSRGTVAINLWTLDVSPILPGEKPARKHKKSSSIDSDIDDSIDEKSKSEFRAVSESEDPSDSDANIRPKKRRKYVKKKKSASSNEESDIEIRRKGKDLSAISTEEQLSIFGKGRICKVVLNDIVAEGQYRIPKDFREEMEISVELETEDLTVKTIHSEKRVLLHEEHEIFEKNHEILPPESVNFNIIHVDSSVEIFSAENNIEQGLKEDETRDNISIIVDHKENEIQILNHENDHQHSTEKEEKDESQPSDSENNFLTENKISIPENSSSSNNSAEEMKESETGSCESNYTKIEEKKSNSGNEVAHTDKSQIDSEQKVTDIETAPLPNESKCTDIIDANILEISTDEFGGLDGKKSQTDDFEDSKVDNDVKDDLDLGNEPSVFPGCETSKNDSVNVIDSDSKLKNDGETSSNNLPDVSNSTLGLSSIDSCEVAKETPKENIEINTTIQIENKSSQLDNGLENKKNSLVNNRNDNFRFRESRKSYRKFRHKYSNNRTLDGWVKRSPVSPRTNMNDGSTHNNREELSFTSSESFENPH
nr:helicase domino isoform X2 [Leptinotarsa decemlineata]